MEISDIKSQSWKLMQVGVVVRDMDKAVERLQSFGFGPFEARTLPPDREEWYRGRPFLGKVKISMAELGDVQLELIQPGWIGIAMHISRCSSIGGFIQYLREVNG